MANPFQTKKFLDLKKKWYTKLEKSGFNDIETDENHMKEWDSSFFARYNIHSVAAKTEYYRLAGQFLHQHEFSSDKEKKIWTLHCEGLSVYQISDKMSRSKSSSKSSIHLVVQRLANKMLEKHGKPKRSDKH